LVRLITADFNERMAYRIAAMVPDGDFVIIFDELLAGARR
jgi:hypothetical protein